MKPHQQEQLPNTAAGLSHLTTMESLALPQELYWDGKSEPNSPPSSELFTIATDLVETENWLYDDNFANEILFLSDEDMDLKPGVEILCDLIDGDELVVELDRFKDESWPPQAVGLTTQDTAYSELDSLVVESPVQQENFFTKPYEVIYNESIQNVGTLTTLTPPQSPPRNGNLLALQEQHLKHQQPHVNAPIQFHTLHYRPTAAAAVPVAPVATPATNTYIAPQSVSTELQSNANDAAQFITDNAAAAAAIKVKNEYVQIIDQILEEFAKDLPKAGDEYESQYTNSPPSQIEESSIDEEWTPTSSAGSSPSRYSSSSSYSGDDEKSADTLTVKKRRPYGRGIEDRKIRKKEQNKNAATRYRQKKKLEMELVLTEEQKLVQRNDELKGKLDKCEREQKYLKELIREFYRNRSG